MKFILLPSSSLKTNQLLLKYYRVSHLQRRCRLHWSVWGRVEVHWAMGADAMDGNGMDVWVGRGMATGM